VNTQRDLPVTANNVRASVEYVHADGERLNVREALWLSVPYQIEFPKKVHLAPGETGQLCLWGKEADGPPSIIEDHCCPAIASESRDNPCVLTGISGV
jgi:hypothetical protein